MIQLIQQNLLFSFQLHDLFLISSDDRWIARFDNTIQQTIQLLIKVFHLLVDVITHSLHLIFAL
ncbi:hypothetical protein [Roseobacter sp. GAI101]|uniref:hypothetical protein n=1 Tax=Roseobacter sp. (strain GAI101) TaxID=391589 RepID=UPI0020C79159|nr:hypothetical protein [Roseobacter sp. GAI101]